MRILESRPVPSFSENVNRIDLISSIPGTLEYRSLVEYFTDYPPTSYMSPSCRALMYCIIRTLKPLHVVEIGTLFAGSSEMIARALWANGQGRLQTIDPFGAERVPGILATWPQELQSCTKFLPINSMQLFGQLAENDEYPDFIFVDGNHDFEFALFDLLCSARQIMRGGIVFMDNFYDPGVALAVQKFERENPAWQHVVFSAHPSFGTTYEGLLLDGLYRCLVAPMAILVDQQPKCFRSQNIEADGISGFRLSFSEPSPAGRLSYKLHLKIIPWEFHRGKGIIEESSASGTIGLLPGERQTTVELAAPLVTKRPREGFNRRYEIYLLFEGKTSGAVLSLDCEPNAIFSYAS
jgi:predicted O-methyltransferase YrrM